MKTKCLLVIAAGLLLNASAAWAQDGRYQDRVTQAQTFSRGPYPDDFRSDDRRRLRRDADRLNQMLDYVRHQVRRYNAGLRRRRELARIESDVSRINYRIRTNYPDRDRLRRQIAQSRADLKRLEGELHFAPEDYFRW